MQKGAALLLRHHVSIIQCRPISLHPMTLLLNFIWLECHCAIAKLFSVNPRALINWCFFLSVLIYQTSSAVLNLHSSDVCLSWETIKQTIYMHSCVFVLFVSFEKLFIHCLSPWIGLLRQNPWQYLQWQLFGKLSISFSLYGYSYAFCKFWQLICPHTKAL